MVRARPTWVLQHYLAIGEHTLEKIGSSFISMEGPLKAHIPNWPCPAELKQVCEPPSNLLDPHSIGHRIKSRGTTM